MNGETHKKQSRAGRPTAEQARQRHQELLQKALKLFLKKGFEQTTLDDIAAAMHMTKRTIYGLYDNKEMLFKAAVKVAISKSRITREQLDEINSDNLESALKTIARLRVEKYLSPEGKQLQRIINAESHRFPELLELVYTESTGPSVEFLVNLLNQHMAAGHIFVDKPEACAVIFLGMAVGVPARAQLSSRHPDKVMNVEEHINYCVQLFLNGVTSGRQSRY